MIGANENPIHGDAVAVAKLYEQKEDLDTRELTAYARTLGITPPDDRPDWYVVQEYGRHGEDLGLFWVGPDDD
jgi:hypothetical protein